MNPYELTDFNNISHEFERLNNFQKDAILNEDKTLLLKASVGSGKTTVLIQKILYLHKIKKIPLEDMVVLTFTNKAANEILERFKAFDIPMNDSSLYFGTFHSIAKKILDNSLCLEKISYKKDFSIIDTDEYLEFLENIIEENKLNIKYKNKLNKRLDLLKNGIRLYGNMKNNDQIELLMELSSSNRKLNNLMTFDDLMDNVLLLLKEFQPNNPFKYVIVDEFQDCNTSQLEMINLLLGDAGYLFAVGDPNQTIYTWRGSKLNIFEEFSKYRSCKYLTLPVNYRSTSTILDIAKVFLNDSSDLKGVRGNGNPIKITNHYNDFNEAIYISEKIKDLVSKGKLYKDICILYRKQNQSNAFLDIFSKEEIPYEISQRKSIKDIPVLSWLLRLLKASLNEFDKFTLVSSLSDEKYGLGLSKAAITNLLNKDLSLEDENTIINKIKNFKYQRPNIDKIYDYFSLDKCLKPNSSTYEEDSFYISTFLDNLKTFIIKSNLNEFDGIKEYINSSALFGTQIIDEKININENSVKLMTLHSSKGLEFDYVFISGANEGLIPMKSKTPEELEEEKRLFFVGITRAKNEIEISYHTSPSGFGVFGVPSQYISMIPSHLKEYTFNETSRGLSLKDMVKEVKVSNIPKIDNTLESAPSKTYVSHNHYGNGFIESIDDGIITVYFEKYGKIDFFEGLEDYEVIENIMPQVSGKKDFEEIKLKIVDLEKQLELVKNEKYNKPISSKKPIFSRINELLEKKFKELFPSYNFSAIDKKQKYRVLKDLYNNYLVDIEIWEENNLSVFLDEKAKKIEELENKIAELLGEIL